MELTVLSYGGGQDSTTLLYKYALDNNFRKKYAPGRLLVIMADTGDEHPHTYKHIQFIKEFCSQNVVEFVHLTNDMGFHSPDWQTLRFFYKTKNRIGSKCFPKTCTERLKLRPIYKYLEYWIQKEYGFKSGRKKGLKQFAETYDKINMLIGIAKGEEKRVNKGERPKWQEKAIEVIYPLIEMGMDRKDCQDYMASTGLHVPYPSNCLLCPFMSEIELLWLYRFYREDYEEWELLERNKIRANALEGDPTKSKNSRGEIVPNMGVWGEKLLPQILEETIKKHGHMSNDELNEYKFNHGCNQSKY